MKVGLVGCVKSKLTRAAPARDLYTSPLFQARRAWVERSTDRWYILSAKHGLVSPSTVLDPYDVTLTDLPHAARRRWSAAVVEALFREIGPLRDHHFEIHAGRAYVDFGLTHGLISAGSTVSLPTAGLGLGRQLQFYAARRPDDVRVTSQQRPKTMVRPSSSPRTASLQPVGNKYARLSAHISAGPWPLTLTFQVIDALVGGLPASARMHRAWWANDASHSHARAWLGCGRTVASVDFTGKSVTFR
jgi:hypothetical protein